MARVLLMAAGIIAALATYVADNTGHTVWDGEAARYDPQGQTVGPESSAGLSGWPLVKVSLPRSGFRRQHTFEDPYHDDGMVVFQIWHHAREQAESTADVIETLLASLANWTSIGALIPSPHVENLHYLIQLLLKHHTSRQEAGTRLQKSLLLYKHELIYQCSIHGAVPFGAAAQLSQAEIVQLLLTGLLAHWRLEEDAGANAALDASGNGRHATAFGSPGSAAGRVGNARTFDRALSQYFQTSSPGLALTGSFSLAAWVYPSGTEERTIVSRESYDGVRRDGYALGFSQDVQRFYLNTWNNRSGAVSNTTAAVVWPPAPRSIVDFNTWYFLFAVYDATAGVVRLSGNNESWQTAAATEGPGVATNPFDIGAFENASVWYWDRRLDEVSVWDRAKTAVERDYLWNAGAGRAWPWQ